MYLWRLVDALREDFPKLATVLGDERFADLVRDYVAAHPSTEPRSATSAARCRPSSPGTKPAYLVDLARLEWTRLEVFDAPDATPLTAADLRRITPEGWPGLRFTLVPACARLVTRWPVHRLWDDAAAPLAPARTALRVWREGFLVYHTAMDPAERRRSTAWSRGRPSRPSARASTTQPRRARSSCAGSRMASSPGPRTAAEIRRPALARRARW